MMGLQLQMMKYKYISFFFFFFIWVFQLVSMEFKDYEAYEKYYYALFLKEITDIVRKMNHRHKFQGVNQLMVLLEDAMFITEVDLRIKYADGYWFLHENQEGEFEKIPDLMNIFGRLYRHQDYDPEAEKEDYKQRMIK